MKNMVISSIMMVLLLAMLGCSQNKFGSFIITTDPSGAKVTDAHGKVYGTSPTGVWTVESKDNAEWMWFVASLAFYNIEELGTWVPAKYKTKQESINDPTRVHLTLDPAYFGSFKIITEPSGAHLTNTYDESYLGVTPSGVFNCTASVLSELERSIRVEKVGYKPIVKTFKVRTPYRLPIDAQNNPMSVFILLEPMNAASGQTNTVRITSDPSGASIYGNQNFWGVTPIEIPVYFSSNTSQIEIRFEKSGYGTERRVLTTSDRQLHVVLHR